MTTAHSTAFDTCCPECGATVTQGREACQTLFDEVLAREFGDKKYARMHRLTVDVYALQHSAEYMFPRPGNPTPRQRGVLTIIHVHEAVAPEDHLRRLHEWAQSAWEAWRAYHHVARQWVEQATANRLV